MRTLWASVVLCLALPACKKPAPPEPPPAAQAASAPARPDASRTVTMEVTEEGFVPSNVALKARESVTLKVTRRTDATCATELVIDGTDLKVKLPLNEQVSIAYTPTKAGTVKFGCAMDMMISGVLLVD
jgi:plastocyanin domain-containing protein